MPITFWISKYACAVLVFRQDCTMPSSKSRTLHVASIPDKKATHMHKCRAVTHFIRSKLFCSGVKCTSHSHTECTVCHKPFCRKHFEQTNTRMQTALFTFHLARDRPGTANIFFSSEQQRLRGDGKMHLRNEHPGEGNYGRGEKWAGKCKMAGMEGMRAESGDKSSFPLTTEQWAHRHSSSHIAKLLVQTKHLFKFDSYISLATHKCK